MQNKKKYLKCVLLILIIAIQIKKDYIPFAFKKLMGGILSSSKNFSQKSFYTSNSYHVFFNVRKSKFVFQVVLKKIFYSSIIYYLAHHV